MLDLNRRPPLGVVQELPIFPLPNVVLLPGLSLALNVFEPRYLALVQKVLARGGYLGIPLLRAPQDHLRKDAAIEPVMGIGTIACHRPASNGHCLIRVEGVGRVRVRREIPTQEPFRRIEGVLLEERAPQDLHRMEILRAVVERLSNCLSPDDRAMVDAWLALEDDRLTLYGLGTVIPSLRLLKAMERGERSPRCPPELDLQQACVSQSDPDLRVELLLAAALEVLQSYGENRGWDHDALN